MLSLFFAGTSLALLWTRLENASFNVDADGRQLVWELLVSGVCGKIEFYRISEPYPVDALASITENADLRKLEPGGEMGTNFLALLLTHPEKKENWSLMAYVCVYYAFVGLWARQPSAK